MADSEWTYYMASPFTGGVVEEMPFTNFRYNEQLNGPGGWEASLPVSHTKAVRAATEPGATLVYAAKGGIVLFGGMLWQATGETGGDLKLGGQGIWSWLRDNRRRILGRTGMTYATGFAGIEVTWTAVDQFRIVADVLAHLNTQQGLIPFAGVTYTSALTPLSGVPRDLTLWTYENPSISQVIEDMGSLDNGFDMSFSYAWSGDTIGTTIDFYYPRKGGQSTTVFEHGKNITLLNHTIDATRMVTTLTATGSGAGDNLLTVDAVDPAKVYPVGGYPGFVGYESHPDVDDQTLLLAYANRALRQQNNPQETVNAKIIQTVDSQLGTFRSGDTVYIVGQEGWIDVNDYYRIEEITVEVGDLGQEEISVVATTEIMSLGQAL